VIRRVLVCASLLVACAGEPRPAAGLDDSGRPLPVGVQARRIVSLSPATTELLFTLGVGSRVVGRTRYDRDPEAALAVPSVGDGLQPNVEVVLAQRPDLVVFYHAAANTPAMARIERAGVPIVALRLDGLDDLVRGTRLLGVLLGVETRADSLVRDLEARLAALASPAGGGGAALLVWTDPPIVIGRSSFLSEIIERAGWANVFGDIQQPSSTVSIEVVAARRPDVLIGGASVLETIRSRAEWAVVDAVREHRLVALEGSAFTHPSYRAPEAIAEVRARLAAVPR
jgi:iron complex transport system substrate-binding protein